MDIPAGWKLVPLTRFVVKEFRDQPNYPFKIIDIFGDEIVDGYVVQTQAQTDADSMNRKWQQKLANAPTAT